MNRAEVVLVWHRLNFEVRWLRLSGTDFQGFFESIMSKSEPDFVAISPSGREGDRKSDGYVPSLRHHFQVYAPPTGIDAAKACAKVLEDFSGVLVHWPDMRCWTFVWSTPRGGLPPQVVRLLDDLDGEHESVVVDQWGQEPLWRRVRDLPDADRVDLFGPAPGPEQITRIDSADVLSMLNTLAARPIPATGRPLSVNVRRDAHHRGINDLEGENGDRRKCWRRARMELERLRLLPPAAKSSEP